MIDRVRSSPVALERLEDLVDAAVDGAQRAERAAVAPRDAAHVALVERRQVADERRLVGVSASLKEGGGRQRPVAEAVAVARVGDRARLAADGARPARLVRGDVVDLEVEGLLARAVALDQLDGALVQHPGDVVGVVVAVADGAAVDLELVVEVVAAARDRPPLVPAGRDLVRLGDRLVEVQVAADVDRPVARRLEPDGQRVRLVDQRRRTRCAAPRCCARTGR